MIAYIIKRDSKTKIKYLTYEEGHGVVGSFVDENFSTTENEIYDILVINGYNSKLIEGCHNTESNNSRYSFRAIRVKDL